MLGKRYIGPDNVNEMNLYSSHEVDKAQQTIINRYRVVTQKNGAQVNARYRILPGKSLSGERPRSLFITLTDGSEIVYKMTECSVKHGYELLTFSRTEY